MKGIALKEEIGNVLMLLGIAMLLVGFGLLMYVAVFVEYGPGRVEREINYGNPGPLCAEVANTYLPLGFISIPTGLVAVYIGTRIKESSQI